MTATCAIEGGIRRIRCGLSSTSTCAIQGQIRRIRCGLAAVIVSDLCGCTLDTSTSVGVRGSVHFCTKNVIFGLKNEDVL